MKMQITALALGLLVGMSAGAAESTGQAITGMDMSTPAPSAVTHQTTGVVKAIDLAKGTITLAHEPVPALKWPAMTMPFKISPELSGGLKPDQRVKVEFTAKGMVGTIARIIVLP